jgi:hypothetical protein
MQCQTLRPQKIGAKAGLGDKLHASLLTLGRERVFVSLLREIAQFGGPIQQLCRFEPELLGQLGILSPADVSLSVPEASAAGVAAGSGSLLVTRSREMRTSSLMQMMRCASSYASL